jgi:ADP-ribose pyrophosphatase YjhB (NUDIX family)
VYRKKQIPADVLWWKEHFSTVRYCYSCGGRLRRRYVKPEKTWRHVCPDCGQITYVNPKMVAGLIPVLADGRVVLLQRNLEPRQGGWTYPAGFQEMKESTQEAAVRETWEEVRARVTVDRLLDVYSYSDTGVATTVYVGRVTGKKKPYPGDESQDVQFFKISEIPWKKLAFRSTRDALRDWIKLQHRKKHK